MNDIVYHLQKWIASSIGTHSWERHDDLHIDEIDPEITTRKILWVDFSLDIYHQLLKLLPDDFKVYLVIRLACADKPTDISKLTFDSIKTQLDFTPPSFYLFPVNNETYNNAIKKMSIVKNLSSNIGMDVYFGEDVEETGTAAEYYRYLYILG